MKPHDCIVIISHSNYRIKSAGVEKYITEVTELLKRYEIQNVHFFPVIEINKRTKALDKEYVGVNVNGIYEGIFDESKLYGLLKLLQQKYDLNYIGVHLNHLHGWNLEILGETLTKLSIPIKIMIHDYEMICGAMLKQDGNGPVCRKVISKPDLYKCRGCKYAKNNILRFYRINEFLSQIDAFVENVIAPSEVAGNAWIHVYERFGNRLIIREHLTILKQRELERTIGNKIRIAYVGSTALHKGFEEWKKLIECLPKNDYEFYYFGNDTQEQRNVKRVNVDFHDGTSMGMTKQLQKNKIDIAFLWSTCLETYCYTAYEACTAGCYLLSVSYSGNISAMIKKWQCGKVFDSLKECLDFLCDVPNVMNELKKYYSLEEILSFVPNECIDELLFYQQRKRTMSKEAKSLDIKTRAKQSYILTFIYGLMRGNYKNDFKGKIFSHNNCKRNN